MLFASFLAINSHIKNMCIGEIRQKKCLKLRRLEIVFLKDKGSQMPHMYMYTEYKMVYDINIFLFNVVYLNLPKSSTSIYISAH